MNTPTKTETLLGGSEFEVALRDGTKAQVSVRQLPIRRMKDYLKAQEDEADMIELACTLNGEPVKAQFVDNLAPESHAALVAEIERVNTDFFLAWGKRQRERGERLKAALTPETSPSPTS
jgi:hypothetical protein